MAVCGRCLICGHKFDGDTTPDVGVRWDCKCDNDYCTNHRESDKIHHYEPRTHAICNPCINGLSDDTLEGAAADLVALLARRSSD